MGINGQADEAGVGRIEISRATDAAPGEWLTAAYDSAAGGGEQGGVRWYQPAVLVEEPLGQHIEASFQPGADLLRLAQQQLPDEDHAGRPGPLHYSSALARWSPVLCLARRLAQCGRCHQSGQAVRIAQEVILRWQPLQM